MPLIKNSWKNLKAKQKNPTRRIQISEPSPKRVSALKEINRLQEQVTIFEGKLKKNKEERALLESKLQAFKDKLEIFRINWVESES